VVGAIDSQFLYLINHGCSNTLFDGIMPVVTWLGSGEVLFGISVVLFIAFMKKAAARAGALLFAGLVVVYYVTFFLKRFIARLRPFISLPDVHLLVAAEKSFSFPSTHAAFAFMAAVVLSGFFSRWRALFFGTAAVVGFSRIYIGVHYVSDVIAGAVIGALTGYVLLWIARHGSGSRHAGKYV